MKALIFLLLTLTFALTSIVSEADAEVDIELGSSSIFPTHKQFRSWLIREAFKYKRVRCLVDVAAVARHYDHLAYLVEKGKVQYALKQFQEMVGYYNKDCGPRNKLGSDASNADSSSCVERITADGIKALTELMQDMQKETVEIELMEIVTKALLDLENCF